MTARVGRRGFTAGAAASALLFPWLARTSRAAAQSPKRAKYLLLFFTNGTDTAAWSPVGSSATRIAFSPMTEPLAPLSPSLVLVEKLSSLGTSDNHAAPGGLTGLGYASNRHISVDQFVSDGLRAQGVSTPIPNLILGGVATEQQTTFYRDGQKLSPIFSPQSAFETIFTGGRSSSASASNGTLLRRRKSVLDHLAQELGALSRQLGAAERQKLELHAESLRQIERRLSGDTAAAPACRPPAAVTPASQDLLNSALHLDLAVEALSCDVTRVASVQFGNHQSTQVSLTEVGEPGDWHNGFIHSDNPRARLVALERWLCTQFVAAAEKLKERAAPDGDGTMFDQTLLVWARDMGDAVGHNGNDMRFVFSGGAGGYLRTAPDGRYVDGSGGAHQQALLNVCEAFGIDDTEGFGDSAAPRAPLSDIGG